MGERLGAFYGVETSDRTPGKRNCLIYPHSRQMERDVNVFQLIQSVGE